MRILLAVKHVGRALGEWDAFALGTALELAEEGDEIVAVTVGDERAEATLRSCLALGAQRAIRVWDPALAETDPLMLATVLAALARREQPELILCGVQSADAGNAATGVALAGLLDLARVAGVVGAEREGALLTVARELERGAVEVLKIALPALLTVQSAVGDPRHATLRAIKQARAKPLLLLAPKDLGLGADALRASAGSRVLRLREREGASAKMLEGDPHEIAAQIATLVRKALSA